MSSATRRYWQGLQGRTEGQLSARSKILKAEEDATLDYDGLRSFGGTGATGGDGSAVRISVAEGDETIITERPPKFIGLRSEKAPIFEETDFSGLGIIVAYILLRAATPLFPTSVSAWPSRLVQVIPSSSASFVRPGDRWRFPVSFGWKVWDRGIVPVLEDPTAHPFLPVNAVNINLHNFVNYTTLLEKMLTASFQAAGFIPP